MDKKKTTKSLNREKQDIPKRKVERKKPQEKKSTNNLNYGYKK